MIVNKDKCTACGTCIANCPVDAISFVNGKAYINKDICISCGMCASICPFEAIDYD